MYGYLVICRWEVLHRSYFLAMVGLLFLLAYVGRPQSANLTSAIVP